MPQVSPLHATCIWRNMCSMICYMKLVYLEIHVLCLQKRTYQGWQHGVYTVFLRGYSKTCLKRPLKRRPKIGFQDRLSLNSGQKYCRMQVKSIAECSKGNILQYFRPSLSYHLSLRPSFCLFLGGPLDRFYITLAFNRTRVNKSLSRGMNLILPMV